MNQPPIDPDVRLGRRRAHGHKTVYGPRVAAVEEVLSRLADDDPQLADLAGRLLGRALRHASVRVQPAEQSAATALAEAGWLEVTSRVEGTAIAFRWVPIRARLPQDAAEAVATWAGRPDPDAVRTGLLDHAVQAGLLPAGPPRGGPPDPARTRLEAETATLAAVTSGSPLQIPAGSLAAGATASWSAYAAGFQAACCWLRQDPARRLTSRELAALAFGDSKAWTQPRKAVFSALLGLSFEEACAHGERAVLIGGALRWSLGGYQADARAAGLWLGLPASSLEQVQLDASEARAVLLIENKDTFEAALRLGVDARHVVVWGSGYVGDAEISLLRRLRLPVGVFADLDPDGIAIVCDVARRCGQTVTPLLMQASYLTAEHSKDADGQQLVMAHRLVADLEPSDQPDLLALAQAIAVTGRVREQETLHAELTRLRDC